MKYFVKRVVFVGAVFFFARYVLPSFGSIPLAIHYFAQGQALEAVKLLLVTIIYTSINFGIFFLLWKTGSVSSNDVEDPLPGHKSVQFTKLPSELQKIALEFNGFLGRLIIQDSQQEVLLPEGKSFIRDDLVDNHALSEAISILKQQKSLSALIGSKIDQEKEQLLRKDKNSAIIQFEIMGKGYKLKWSNSNGRWKLNILAFVNDLKSPASSNFA